MTFITDQLEKKLKEIIYNAGDIALEERKKGLKLSTKFNGSIVSSGDINVSDYIYKNSTA